MLFLLLFLFFFFFKQKTAYEMRISDWSSDVCSSDLRGRQRQEDDGPVRAAAVERHPDQRKEEIELEFRADGPEDRLRAGEAEQPQELLAVYAIDERRIGIAEEEERSEERRVGKEWVSTSRSRWWPDH